MSLFTGILQGQAPPKQDATLTIQTLCLRLTSSTLLEDRRAAIMGLRSLARDHKEIVASEGLRGLIGTLSRDREDLDTVKVVLETLLQLFVGDDVDPNGSEDIALWLADEFTQKQENENIRLLIDLLDDVDFYIRLLTLQLLLDILSKRPARTQECVFAAQGITKLVAILDDKRDVIRNEAVLLLIQLSSGNTNIQQLIAFESAFERIFMIIDLEGGVEGGIIVQDCLKLLSNLLSFNHLNQNSFREARGIPALAKLFQLSEDEISPYAREQRDSNLQFSLGVVRLFVVPGGLGTLDHQLEFAAAGILERVLGIAFTKSSSLPVQAEALSTVADLIDGNGHLQAQFGPAQVSYEPTILPAEAPEDGRHGVIESLLDVTLLSSSTLAFDVRLAACRCLEAYFNGNPSVRRQFLLYARQLWEDGDKAANMLTCLTNLDSGSRGDPYRVWFASVMLIHLLWEDVECKIEATSIKEGNAEAGEEEVTAIQRIASNLITALEHDYDPRIPIGYLMLLCIWLYEDSEAVDDFLSEGASIQSLISAVTQSGKDPVLQGLAAFLLGTLYEFSHKESPVPRATLHPLLQSRMGRDHYLNKITKLRSDRRIRDFEVVREEFEVEFKPRKHGLPEVYFEHIFVGFLKDNYSRILRAIDKDPGMETHITANGVTKTANGVSLELLESLKTQLETKSEDLMKTENTCLTLEQRLAHEQTERQRERESAAAEARKHAEAIEAQRRRNEAELATAQDKSRALVDEITKRNRRSIEEREMQIQNLKKQVENLARRNKDGEAQYHALARQLESLSRQSSSAIEEKEERIQQLTKQMAEVVQRTKTIIQQRDEQIQKLNGQVEDLAKQKDDLTSQHESLVKRADAAEKALSNGSERELSLQNRLVELRDEKEHTIQELRGDNEKMIFRMREELQKNQDDGARKLAAQETRISEAEERASSALTELKIAKVALFVSKDQLKALQQEHETASSQTIELEDNIKRLQKSFSDAEQRTMELEQQLKNATQGKADLEEKLHAAEKRLSHASSSSSDAEGKLAGLNQQLQTLEMERRVLQDRLQTTYKKLQASENKRQDVENVTKGGEIEHEQALQAWAKKQADAEAQAKMADAKSRDAEARANDAEEKLRAAKGVTQKALQEKAVAEKTAKNAQAELDDMLIMLAELEDKNKELKARLKAKGEEVSDDEDDEGEEGGDDDGNNSDDVD